MFVFVRVKDFHGEWKETKRHLGVSATQLRNFIHALFLDRQAEGLLNEPVHTHVSFQLICQGKQTTLIKFSQTNFLKILQRR